MDVQNKDIKQKDKYLRPEEATKLLNVSNQTLVNWTNEGLIPCVRTKGKHRRYLYSDVISKLPEKEKPEEFKVKRDKVCYCRVSTRSQKEDLERQVEFFRRNYPTHIIVSDYGSGLNFKRKGFQTLVDRAIKGTLSEVVVTHKDRLCRFGFELYEYLLQTCSNGKVLVLDQKQTSPEEELVNDLVSIITVFSSRLYGLRSHSIKRKIKEATFKKGAEIKNNNNEIISNSRREGRVESDAGAIQMVL